MRGTRWSSLAVLLGLVGGSLAAANAPAAAAVGVDVTDRAAVLAEWNTITATAPAIGFTGNVGTCTPGTTSAAFRAAGLERLNAYRSLAGVAAVTENTTWSAQAQSAAMIMAANRTLSHTPPSTWACYNTPGTSTPAPGVAAAGRSNLAAGSTGPTAVTQYVRDSGTPSLGHRRWVVCPYVTQVGMGDVPATSGDRYAGGYNAQLHNFGSTSAWSTRDGFVAFPNKGLVPWKQASDLGLLKDFSFQVPSGTAVSSPSVAVTSSTGAAVTASVTNSENGYCGNGVMWAPSRPPASGETWTITVAGLSTGAVTYATTFFGEGDPEPAPDVRRLVGGQTLTGSDVLRSTSGQFEVRGSLGMVQTDANGRTLWSVGARPSRLAMQTDGNLVLYTDAGALWSSGTWGNPGAYAVVQDDANVVVYSAAGRALWSNNGFDDEVLPSSATLDRGLSSRHQLISADRRVRLVMQPDGNLVGYGPSGVLWATNTWGNPGARLVMQGDGNLVVYPAAGGRALWSSATNDRGARRLVVQSDGNIVVYGASGPLWATWSRA